MGLMNGFFISFLSVIMILDEAWWGARFLRKMLDVDSLEDVLAASRF